MKQVESDEIQNRSLKKKKQQQQTSNRALASNRSFEYRILVAKPLCLNDLDQEGKL